jgi:hypothetical protein
MAYEDQTKEPFIKEFERKFDGFLYKNVVETLCREQ